MASRTGAPGAVADALDLLQGAVSSERLAALRRSLAFLELDRFEAARHQQQPDLEYVPQCRPVRWGGLQAHARGHRNPVCALLQLHFAAVVPLCARGRPVCFDAACLDLKLYTGGHR